METNKPVRITGEIFYATDMVEFNEYTAEKQTYVAQIGKLSAAAVEKLRSAACSERTHILRPSSPGTKPLPAYFDTVSRKRWSEGVPLRKEAISLSPSLAPPLTIEPIFAGPAPYKKA